MQIHHNVFEADAAYPGLALSVGSFDGVHLGHQKILQHLKHAAAARGGTAAVMTLRPHPRQIFTPDNPPNILTPDDVKEELLAAAGVDVLYYLPFSKAVAAMPPRQFLEELVLGKCKASAMVVGHDFSFGKDAAGNYAWLEQTASHYGLAVEEVPPLILHGERVSSTLIRELILEGAVEQLPRFLGRRYAIRGRVERGREIGRALGYPTANIRPDGTTVPAHGIYVAEAVVEGARRPAAVNVGIAPTIRHEDTMVEAFLLDFEGDLVGAELDIVFHKRLRPERKFPDYASLIAAIGEDVRQVLGYFAAGGPAV